MFSLDVMSIYLWRSPTMTRTTNTPKPKINETSRESVVNIQLVSLIMDETKGVLKIALVENLKNINRSMSMSKVVIIILFISLSLPE